VWGTRVGGGSTALWRSEGTTSTDKATKYRSEGPLSENPSAMEDAPTDATHIFRDTVDG
jgi:hypothetical protein